MPNFSKEEDFDKYYYSLNDPEKERVELVKWRRFQMDVVSKFIKQIKLIANDQYTNLDHFFLELLQNADDNEYPEGVEKTFKLTLSNDFVEIENNEKGFTAENLYAITYSGASTKSRTKTSKSYIGEKGIGFKSVFAVAEYVDIHSPPYHFRLKNDEYIIPHSIPPVKVEGTRIVLKLKPTGYKIREILSDRIKTLANGAQEFTLFLQQLEKLELEDKTKGISSNVISARDDDKNYYVISHDGVDNEYIKKGYTHPIPVEIAKTRFDEINEDINREITFAVPLPPSGGGEPINNGLLFCFLPTSVRTGLPIHIQADAKTTTNRENIQAFATSDWNGALFSNFTQDMLGLYIELSKQKEFNDFLPIYWPHNVDSQELGNNDLNDLLLEVENELGQLAVFLDRHGDYRVRDSVRILPKEFGDLFCEDKYEKALTYYFIDYEEGTEEDNEDKEYWEKEIKNNQLTFISPLWSKKYLDRLENQEVQYIDSDDVVAILDQGPPDSISVLEDESVRLFLGRLMDYANSTFNFSSNIRQLPIYPLIVDGKRKWGSINEHTMWLQTDSARLQEGVTTVIVDPVFTYSPGGGQKKDGKDEEIRSFNLRFRKFLSDNLEIPAYSEEELLKRSIIPELVSIEVDIGKKDEREKVISLWKQLYTKIWRRRKTIINESSEAKLDELFYELAKCKIPTREAGTQNWKLIPASLAFLGSKFGTVNNLEKIYENTGAPIIDLSEMERTGKKKKKKKKSDIAWDQWREFLIQCGAEVGPYFVDEDLKDIDSIGTYLELSESEDDTPLLSQIKNSIMNHSEVRWEKPTSVTLCRGSSTVTIDQYTIKLITELKNLHNIFLDIGNLYNEFQRYKTGVKFYWGLKQNCRSVTIKRIAALDQITNGFMIESTEGIVISTSCYVKNQENERILGNLVPLIDGVGFNSDYLHAIGVTEKVSVDSLEELIIKWIDISDKQKRTIHEFLPYIDMVTTYALLNTHEQHVITLRIKLFNPITDSLVSLNEWLNEAVDMGYSESVVSKLSLSLEVDLQRTPVQLLDALFSIGELTRDEDVLRRILVEIGEHLSDGVNNLGNVFRKKLSEQGVIISGQTITQIEKLPFIWDRTPLPIDKDDLLVLRPSTRQAKKLRLALEELKWPYLSKEKPEIRVNGKKAVDQINARRIYLSISEILSSLKEDKPNVAKKVESLNLFKTLEEVKSNVLLVDDLQIEISQGNNNLIRKVPYWFEKGELLLDRTGDLAVELPTFVDDYAGTTLKSLFHYVWDAKESESRIYPGTDGKTGDITPPDYTGGGYKGEAGVGGEPVGSTSDLDDDIFDDDEDEQDADKGNGNDETETEPKDRTNPPKRKRLHSMVLTGKMGSSNGSSGQNSNTQHNDEVEEAGRRRMIDYFETQGAEVVSRESENVGYDFEVTIGEETIYIELKSSQDQWEGWEHSISANEFKTALELSDKFFLCAIDYAFNDEDYQIYFIRNPANESDFFLFDSPWKALSVKMSDYISRLKDKQGI